MHVLDVFRPRQPPCFLSTRVRFAGTRKIKAVTFVAILMAWSGVRIANDELSRPRLRGVRPCEAKEAEIDLKVRLVGAASFVKVAIDIDGAVAATVVSEPLPGGRSQREVEI